MEKKKFWQKKKINTWPKFSWKRNEWNEVTGWLVLSRVEKEIDANLRYVDKHCNSFW